MKHTIVLSILAVLGTLALIFVFQTQLEAETDDTYRPVKAEITSFGAGTQYGGVPASIMVYAQTEDGAIGYGNVAPESVEGCRVGDTIAAEQKGGILRLKPSPCR